MAAAVVVVVLEAVYRQRQRRSVPIAVLSLVFVVVTMMDIGRIQLQLCVSSIDDRERDVTTALGCCCSLEI